MSNNIRTPYLPSLAEDRCDKLPRNCDRFNTGNPTADLVSAVKHFASETGITVYNLAPGFNSAGDFALWLMSATKEKGIIQSKHERFNSIGERADETAKPKEDECEVVIETICAALQTVANNLIGDELRFIQHIIHSLKSEWEHRRHQK